MKLAFCLYGLVGSTTNKYGFDKPLSPEIAYKFYKKNVFNQFRGHVDIFLHSQSFNHKKQLINLYKPKLYKIEKQKKFKQSLNHPHLKKLKLLKFKNLFEKLYGSTKSLDKYNYLKKKAVASYSRWYSFQQAIKLKKKFEEKKKFKYDLVFITRYDLIIKSKYLIHNFDPLKLTVPFHNTVPAPQDNYKNKPTRNNKTHYKGISDFWFAASSKNMDKFANLYNRIEEYPLTTHFSSYNHSKYLNLELDYKYYRYFDHELWRRMNKSPY